MFSRIKGSLLFWCGLIVLAAAPRVQGAIIFGTSGALSTDGDVFEYAVVVPQSGTLRVYSTGTTDTVGHLLNSGGTELAADDDSGGYGQFSLSASVSPGTYTIRVHGYAYAATGSFSAFADFTPSGGGSIGPNTIPQIASFSVTPASASPGQQVRVVLNATDDGNMNAYVIRHVGFGGINPGGVGAPPNSGTSLAADFYYTLPLGSPTGANTFRVEIGDSNSVGGNAATYAIQEISINVGGSPVNAPPNAVFNDGPLSLPVGQPGTWDYSVSDTNGNLARWSLRVLPGSQNWQTIGGSVQTNRATMTFTTVGNYTLRLDVEDTLGLSTSVDRVVHVAPSNAPTITSPTVIGTVLNAAFSLTITATNSPKSYAVSGLPPGLSFNPSTRTISGTPSQAGSYSVIASATNAYGTGTATLSIAVTTSTLSANVALTQAVIRPTTGTVTQNLQFTGYSSATTLTHYRYSINRPDGSVLESSDWVAFQLAPQQVLVSEGHYEQQWVETGHVETQTITDWSNVYEWVSSGYYEMVYGPWDAPGFWDYVPGQGMVYFPPQQLYGWNQVYVDTSGYQWHWVATGTHTEEVWVVDGGHYEQVWVDTSHYETQTLPQPIMNGATVRGVSITPTASTGTYTVVLDVKNSSNQVATASRTYDVIAPPAGTVVASAATGQTSTGFSANWTALSGATGYQLDVASNAAFTAPLFLGNYSVSGGSTTSLAVTGLAPNTTYYYRVRAFNAAGTTGNSNVISVVGAPLATPATGIAGTSFTANWTTITGATSYRLDVSASSAFASFLLNNQTVTATTQSVTGLTANTTYYYRVRAANADGIGANSNTVTVVPVPVIGSALTATGTVGTTFSYAITATNTPTSFSATTLPAGLSVNSTNGVISGTPSQAGSISVTLGAANASGTGSATLALTINAVPAITNQPQSQSVSVGAAATFTVVATGTPTPTYQWRKDGVNIAGATGTSYAINSAQASDAGSYTVVVSNSVGTVVSGAAVLSVVAPPIDLQIHRP